MKTLLFSLSSSDVFKNFFFFPGGVFDMLKSKVNNSNDLRVVFLVQARELEHFNIFLKDYSGNKLIIEPIVLPSKDKLIQKLFRFFYSYLVYTGTTRTLATMGMRSDDAPGGGKRYLAPVKIFIANTFGRMRFFKTKVVPFLYKYFFKEQPFLPVFKKYNPDKVFVGNLFNQFDMKLLAEAKRQSVASVGMVTGWDHFDKYFFPLQTDILLAQSEQTRRFAINYQAYDSKKVIAVGYPYFDFIVRKENAISREEVLKNLGFASNSKYVLYIAGSAYCPDEPDIIETILKWADEGRFGCDFRLVVRPYPGGRGKDIDFDEKKFEGFKNHPRVSFQLGKFWGDLEKSKNFLNIMRHADVVIALYSTAVLEASVFDRPLITTSFDGYNKRPFARSIKRFELREHFKDVIKTGAMKRAQNFDELFKFINDYLKNPKLDVEKRDALRQDLLYKLDGKTSERIYKYLVE